MATLRANISGKEHDTDNWEMASETMKGPLDHPKISWTYGPLMAKNKIVIFIHLPKTMNNGGIPHVVPALFLVVTTTTSIVIIHSCYWLFVHSSDCSSL